MAKASVYDLKGTHLGDAKSIFNYAALGIGIGTVDSFKKVLAGMAKHAFPPYNTLFT